MICLTEFDPGIRIGGLLGILRRGLRLLDSLLDISGGLDLCIGDRYNGDQGECG